MERPACTPGSATCALAASRGTSVLGGWEPDRRQGTGDRINGAASKTRDQGPCSWGGKGGRKEGGERRERGRGGKGKGEGRRGGEGGREGGGGRKSRGQREAGAPEAPAPAPRPPGHRPLLRGVRAAQGPPPRWPPARAQEAHVAHLADNGLLLLTQVLLTAVLELSLQVLMYL